MRTVRPAIAAALVLAAAPAASQLSNHGIALETGASAPPRVLGDALVGVAVSAWMWIDGDLEAVARVAFPSVAGTKGRDADPSVSGTIGLRLSLLPDPLRPQLQGEIGWARVAVSGAAEDRLALGVCAGLEWFPARDASLALRLALRGYPGDPRAEAALAASIYF